MNKKPNIEIPAGLPQDDVVKCPNCKSPNNHISSINIINGNDRYKSTIEMRVSSKILKDEDETEPSIPSFTTTIIPLVKKSTYRMRYELGAEINFECEQCPDKWSVAYTHHKGEIHRDIFTNIF